MILTVYKKVQHKIILLLNLGYLWKWSLSKCIYQHSFATPRISYNSYWNLWHHFTVQWFSLIVHFFSLSFPFQLITKVITQVTEKSNHHYSLWTSVWCWTIAQLRALSLQWGSHSAGAKPPQQLTFTVCSFKPHKMFQNLDWIMKSY